MGEQPTRNAFQSVAVGLDVHGATERSTPPDARYVIMLHTATRYATCGVTSLLTWLQARLVLQTQERFPGNPRVSRKDNLPFNFDERKEK